MFGVAFYCYIAVVMMSVSCLIVILSLYACCISISYCYTDIELCVSCHIVMLRVIKLVEAAFLIVMLTLS